MEQKGWKIGDNHYLSIQNCDDGYDYTLYSIDYSEIDGGQLDMPDLSIMEASKIVVKDFDLPYEKMKEVDYEELQNNIEKAEESFFDKERKMEKPNRVYMNVHNVYAKIGLEDQKNNRTYNVVSLPKGVTLGDKDLSGARIYPLDNYIYPNKLNSNLTTVQFLENQEIRVNFNDGDFEYINAKELTDAVDLANKKYLEENRNRMIEAEKEVSKYRAKEKNKEDEYEI